MRKDPKPGERTKITLTKREQASLSLAEWVCSELAREQHEAAPEAKLAAEHLEVMNMILLPPPPETK